VKDSSELTPRREADSSELTLSLEHIGISFGGARALSDVSMQVASRTIHGLAGANGSGKTTLLNILTGILRRYDGKALFQGRDIASYRSHHLAVAGIARMFQTPVVFGDLTVLENVMLGAQKRIRGGPWNDLVRLPAYRARLRAAEEEAAALLSALDVPNSQWSEPAGDLTIGQQRRVELARALAVHPALLLLDEPAAGLSRRELTELAALLEVIRDAGVTVLIVEHNVEFLRGAADHVTILDHGLVIADGGNTVFDDPEVIRLYIGEAQAVPRNFESHISGES
jgi:branched-chain amino acid transport system permease protein